MQFKGRQLGFLLLLCGGWAVARTIMLSAAPDIDPRFPYSVAISDKAIARPLAKQPIIATPAPPPGISERPINAGNKRPASPRRSYQAAAPNRRLPERLVLARGTLGRIPTAPKAAAASAKPASASITPRLNSGARPFAEIYAYSFWRRSTKAGALATAGQYGGSQSGLIVTIPLRGIGLFDNGENLSLMFRAVVTPDSRADREVAAGLRWRPASSLPVTVTAERRFRPVGPDRVAVYIAGGVDKIALPAKFDLDSYAQAGVVSGRNAGPFFDGAAHVYRPVYSSDGLAAKTGVGAWAGGQRGASRLDIGPSMGVEVSVADIRLRINADWRFRVAGNARPGNGPALTLSTGF